MHTASYTSCSDNETVSQLNVISVPVLGPVFNHTISVHYLLRELSLSYVVVRVNESDRA